MNDFIKIAFFLIIAGFVTLITFLMVSGYWDEFKASWGMPQFQGSTVEIVIVSVFLLAVVIRIITLPSDD